MTSSHYKVHRFVDEFLYKCEAFYHVISLLKVYSDEIVHFERYNITKLEFKP